MSISACVLPGNLIKLYIDTLDLSRKRVEKKLVHVMKVAGLEEDVAQLLM